MYFEVLCTWQTRRKVRCLFGRVTHRRYVSERDTGIIILPQLNKCVLSDRKPPYSAYQVQSSGCTVQRLCTAVHSRVPGSSYHSSDYTADVIYHILQWLNTDHSLHWSATQRHPGPAGLMACCLCERVLPFLSPSSPHELSVSS